MAITQRNPVSSKKRREKKMKRNGSKVLKEEGIVTGTVPLKEMWD